MDVDENDENIAPNKPTNKKETSTKIIPNFANQSRKSPTKSLKSLEACSKNSPTVGDENQGPGKSISNTLKPLRDRNHTGDRESSVLRDLVNKDYSKLGARPKTLEASLKPPKKPKVKKEVKSIYIDSQSTLETPFHPLEKKYAFGKNASTNDEENKAKFDLEIPQLFFRNQVGETLAKKESHLGDLSFNNENIQPNILEQSKSRDQKLSIPFIDILPSSNHLQQPLAQNNLFGSRVLSSEKIGAIGLLPLSDRGQLNASFVIDNKKSRENDRQYLLVKEPSHSLIKTNNKILKERENNVSTVKQYQSNSRSDSVALPTISKFKPSTTPKISKKNVENHFPHSNINHRLQHDKTIKNLTVKTGTNAIDARKNIYPNQNMSAVIPKAKEKLKTISKNNNCQQALDPSSQRNVTNLRLEPESLNDTKIQEPIKVPDVEKKKYKKKASTEISNTWRGEDGPAFQVPQLIQQLNAYTYQRLALPQNPHLVYPTFPLKEIRKQRQKHLKLLRKNARDAVMEMLKMNDEQAAGKDQNKSKKDHHFSKHKEVKKNRNASCPAKSTKRMKSSDRLKKAKGPSLNEDNDQDFQPSGEQKQSKESNSTTDPSLAHCSQSKKSNIDNPDQKAEIIPCDNLNDTLQQELFNSQFNCPVADAENKTQSKCGLPIPPEKRNELELNSAGSSSLSTVPISQNNPIVSLSTPLQNVINHTNNVWMLANNQLNGLSSQIVNGTSPPVNLNSYPPVPSNAMVSCNPSVQNMYNPTNSWIKPVLNGSNQSDIISTQVLNEPPPMLSAPAPNQAILSKNWITHVPYENNSTGFIGSHEGYQNNPQVILSTQTPNPAMPLESCSTQMPHLNNPPVLWNTQVPNETNPSGSTQMIKETDSSEGAQMVNQTKPSESTRIIYQNDPSGSKQIIYQDNTPGSTRIIYHNNPPSSTEMVYQLNPQVSTKMIYQNDIPGSTQAMYQNNPPELISWSTPMLTQVHNQNNLAGWNAQVPFQNNQSGSWSTPIQTVIHPPISTSTQVPFQYNPSASSIQVPNQSNPSGSWSTQAPNQYNPTDMIGAPMVVENQIVYNGSTSILHEDKANKNIVIPPPLSINYNENLGINVLDSNKSDVSSNAQQLQPNKNNIETQSASLLQMKSTYYVNTPPPLKLPIIPVYNGNPRVMVKLKSTLLSDKTNDENTKKKSSKVKKKTLDSSEENSVAKIANENKTCDQSDPVPLKEQRTIDHWESIQSKKKETVHQTNTYPLTENESNNQWGTLPSNKNEPVNNWGSPPSNTNEPINNWGSPPSNINEPINNWGTPPLNKNEPGNNWGTPPSNTNKPINSWGTSPSNTNKPINNWGTLPSNKKEPINNWGSPPSRKNEAINHRAAPKQKESIKYWGSLPPKEKETNSQWGTSKPMENKSINHWGSPPSKKNELGSQWGKSLSNDDPIIDQIGEPPANKNNFSGHRSQEKNSTTHWGSSPSKDLNSTGNWGTSPTNDHWGTSKHNDFANHSNTSPSKNHKTISHWDTLSVSKENNYDDFEDQSHSEENETISQFGLTSPSQKDCSINNWGTSPSKENQTISHWGTSSIKPSEVTVSDDDSSSNKNESSSQWGISSANDNKSDENMGKSPPGLNNWDESHSVDNKSVRDELDDELVNAQGDVDAASKDQNEPIGVWNKEDYRNGESSVNQAGGSQSPNNEPSNEIEYYNNWGDLSVDEDPINANPNDQNVNQDVNGRNNNLSPIPNPHSFQWGSLPVGQNQRINLWTSPTKSESIKRADSPSESSTTSESHSSLSDEPFIDGTFLGVVPPIPPPMEVPRPFQSAPLPNVHLHIPFLGIQKDAEPKEDPFKRKKKIKYNMKGPSPYQIFRQDIEILKYTSNIEILPPNLSVLAPPVHMVRCLEKTEIKEVNSITAECNHAGFCRDAFKYEGCLNFYIDYGETMVAESKIFFKMPKPGDYWFHAKVPFFDNPRPPIEVMGHMALFKTHYRIRIWIKRHDTPVHKHRMEIDIKRICY